jgi:hypothetical protein
MVARHRRREVERDFDLLARNAFRVRTFLALPRCSLWLERPSGVFLCFEKDAGHIRLPSRDFRTSSA